MNSNKTIGVNVTMMRPTHDYLNLHVYIFVKSTWTPRSVKWLLSGRHTPLLAYHGQEYFGDLELGTICIFVAEDCELGPVAKRYITKCILLNACLNLSINTRHRPTSVYTCRIKSVVANILRTINAN